ncbi:hypothetical protein HanPSC8_Chr08g0319271 [Helianthus annuus]|nr:hypothetical protein HanPSC8_Chr08g0319271 [Helianthus annuus]
MDELMCRFLESCKRNPFFKRHRETLKHKIGRIMKDFRPEIAVRGHNQTHKRLRVVQWMIQISVSHIFDFFFSNTVVVITPTMEDVGDGGCGWKPRQLRRVPVFAFSNSSVEFG